VLGCDRTLAAALGPTTTRERAVCLLSEWASFVDREVSLLQPGYPTLWHPSVSPAAAALIRGQFRERLVELSAQTFDDALHHFRLTPWNLGVFYHVACTGHWREVLDEQISLLCGCGLTEVRAAVLGSEADRRHVEREAERHGVYLVVSYHHDDLRMYEIPTIRLVWEWAQAHDGYVLYFHTKGVGTPGDVVKQDWRRLMNRFVIDRWRANAALLRDGHDAVGVNWLDCPPVSHFPGNFWMARTAFLRELEPFPRYYRNPRHDCRGHEVNQQRLAAEFWIGSGPRPPRVFSHVTRGEAIDRPAFWARHKPLIPEVASS
jgi:hypothetical protein